MVSRRAPEGRPPVELQSLELSAGPLSSTFQPPRSFPSGCSATLASSASPSFSTIPEPRGGPVRSLFLSPFSRSFQR